MNRPETQVIDNLVLVATDKCPVCESSEGQTTLLQLDSFSVKRCRCGHKFIDPSLNPQSQMFIYQSSEALRKINPALEHYYEHDLLDERTVTYRDYMQTLEKIEGVTKGRGLLEVGCGTGSFLKAARKRGWVSTGIDSSVENIEKIRQAGMEGICANFLEYNDNRVYDCIAFWDLVEHIQTPRIFLEKAFRLLAPGGVLLIAVPHYPNILSTMAEMIYQVSFGKVTAPARQLYMLEHTSYFSAETIKLLLERCGFRTVRLWKTETDLDRYSFSPPLKLLLQAAFLAARLLGRQNRMNVLARKKLDA